MENVIKQIGDLRNSKIRETIDDRIKEFNKYKNSKKNKIFSELCFCLLTANFQAEKSMQIQNKLEKNFETDTREELALKLKQLGHRFWPQRAERIVEARKYKKEIDSIIFKKDDYEMRDWIVKNIKGLGMKESSHFLRNVGYKNLAIIDFHIVDLLVKENLIEKPKTITPKKYIEIENVLKKIAEESGLNLAELDLYLWYIETGKILK